MQSKGTKLRKKRHKLYKKDTGYKKIQAIPKRTKLCKQKIQAMQKDTSCTKKTQAVKKDTG